MRILSMANHPPNPNSGAAGTVYQTNRALRKLGHEVEEIWSEDLGRWIGHGNLHYLLELPWRFHRALAKRLAERHYDVVEISQPHGYLAARSLRSTDTVFVHRSHGLESRLADEVDRWREAYGRESGFGPRRWLRRGMAHALRVNIRQTLRYADGHVVGTREDGAYLREEMAVPAERIEVVSRAAPDSFLKEEARPMTPTRLERVLYVGQLAFFKAPMVAAEVIGRLAERGKDMEFTWVAGSSDHDAIRGLLGPAVRPRVRLMDWMPQEVLMPLMDEHGIFLFPSFCEGFGKVFLEAMSRGLCVVAADNSGAHDVIRDGVDGFLVPTGDAEEMDRACGRLLDDPDLAGRVSSNAVSTARGYTWRRVAEKSVAFYERLIEAKRN